MLTGMHSSHETMQPCYVYVIGPCSGPVKVGIANDVVDRKKALQKGSPVNLVTYLEVKLPTRRLAGCVEQIVHWRLRSDAVSSEWFNCSPDKVMATVKDVVAALGA